MMSEKQGLDFTNYARGLYGNSLVTGLPEIIQSHNWGSRLLRTSVFVACVGGFIYQSLQFMNMYWEYPTNLDIQINAVAETMMPAITVCHPAGIMLSEYCKYYPCKTFSKWEDRDFCHCYIKGRYCDKGRLRPGVQIPIDNYNIKRLSLLPQSEIKHLFIKPDEFIHDCMVFQPPDTAQKKCRPAKLTPSCTSTLPQATTCFSINSLIGQPHRVPDTITPSTVIHLSLAYAEWDTDNDVVLPEKYFSIHSPYRLSNPFLEGIQLRKREITTLFITQVAKTLLKAPYDTDCHDYMEDWKTNGGTGPTNRLDCIETCKMEYFRTKYNCQPYAIAYPHEEARCPPQDCFIKMFCLYKDFQQNNTYGSEYEDMVTDCSKNCKEACCFNVIDVVEVETGMQNPALRFINKQLDYKLVVENNLVQTKVQRKFYNEYPVYNESNITVIFQRMDETAYTYKAKYDPVETFSYIGGYIGIWLGVSLVALFDFLETTFILLRYPLMRFRLAKQRRRLRKALVELQK